MAVTKNNGIYFGDFTVEGRRHRPRLNAKTKREANTECLILKKEEADAIIAKKNDFPFAKSLNIFLTQFCGYKFTSKGERTFTRRSIKEGTAERYFTSSRMLTPFFMGKTLRHISKDDIVEYIESRRDGTKDIKPCSDPTILRDLRMFSRMINFTIENTSWDGGNIVMRFDKKYLKDSKDRIRSLDEVERESLLKNAKLSRNKDLYYEIKLALLTGLRWNEQFSLLRSDFERTNFGPQLILKDSVTKNGKFRVVPLDDESLEIVEYLLQKPLSKHGYMFYNADTGDRVNSNRSSWLTCLEKSKITDFRWHDLRHTYATDEIKKGMPIYQLSKMLGHSNVTITEKYAHLYTEDLHEAKRKASVKKPTMVVNNISTEKTNLDNKVNTSVFVKPNLDNKVNTSVFVGT